MTDKEMIADEIQNEPKKKITPEELSTFCMQIADSKKAGNIKRLALGELTVIADYFVLCTANSEPHIKAVADGIVREARTQLKVRPLKVDGLPASHWIIIDYGAVIVHVMHPESRDLYQLESLWGDAPSTELIEKLGHKTHK